MTASGARNVTGVAGPAPALPPWMMLWLVAFAINLPPAVQGWLGYAADLTGSGSYGPGVAATTSFGLLSLLAFVQLLPSVMIVVGLLAVLFPQLRARVVEWWLELADEDRAVVREIEGYLREIGADVRVRINLADQRRLARVYPAGWRRARLAVFGPFAVLWRRDPAAARAVLRHEIAHVRTGDHILLGLGSPLVALVNLWLPVLVIFGVLPVLGLAVVRYPTAVELSGQLVLLLTSVPRMLLLPVAAMWCAELSADRHAAAGGHTGDLLRALDGGTPGRGRYRKVLFHLSHPPTRLRRSALGGGRATDLLLLVAWPFTSLVLLAVIVAGAVPASLLAGYDGEETFDRIRLGVGTFVTDNARLWLPAVALLASWPVVAAAWSRLWVGGHVARPGISAGAYGTAACAVGAVMAALLLAST